MGCFLVTGCAGFVGSNLVDRLLRDGHQVIGFDNFATGRRAFLEQACASPAFKMVVGDVLDRDALAGALRQGPVEAVFHLAANADVSRGTEQPRKDLEQNTIATFNVLDCMREAGVKKIVFSSTGSIYGESKVVPTPEDAPFPVQTSLYGASKLAGEGLITAYCEGFGFQAWIYRFVSVLGERYTHGHVYDFYRKLRADPTQIEVFGDGGQTKAYMYVGDCIEGMLLGMEKAQERVNILNLGVDGTIRVRDSLGLICERLGLSPKYNYTGGARGWIGDNPLIHLNCSRIYGLGWKPTLTIEQGVLRTLDWLIENQWVYEEQP